MPNQADHPNQHPLTRCIENHFNNIAKNHSALLRSEIQRRIAVNSLVGARIKADRAGARHYIV